MSGTVAGAAAAALGFGDFAALGPVSFMLLGSPESMSRRRRTNFAKLPLLNARPVQQFTFDDLEELDMGIRLHVFWCVPDDAVALLDQVRTAHQPQPLVFGPGQQVGQYVVTDMTIDDQWRYAGVAQHIDVKLSLREWAPTLPVGAPTVQPTAPTPGVIGVPGGFAAIFSAGAGIGLPVPIGEFASVAASTIVRAGAP